MTRPSSLVGRSILIRSRLLTVSIETFHRSASSRLVNNAPSVDPSVTSLSIVSLLPGAFFESVNRPLSSNPNITHRFFNGYVNCDKIGWQGPSGICTSDITLLTQCVIQPNPGPIYISGDPPGLQRLRHGPVKISSCRPQRRSKGHQDRADACKWLVFLLCFAAIAP
jgi:hypothetical protein